VIHQPKMWLLLQNVLNSPKSKKMFSSITLEMQVEVPIFSFSSCFDYTKLCYCRRTTIHTGAKLYFSINSISVLEYWNPIWDFHYFETKSVFYSFEIYFILLFEIASFLAQKLNFWTKFFSFVQVWLYCLLARKCQGSRVLGSFAIKGSSVEEVSQKNCVSGLVLLL